MLNFPRALLTSHQWTLLSGEMWRAAFMIHLNLQDLRQCIVEAFNAIPRRMIILAMQDMDRGACCHNWCYFLCISFPFIFSSCIYNNAVFRFSQGLGKFMFVSINKTECTDNHLFWIQCIFFIVVSHGRLRCCRECACSSEQIELMDDWHAKLRRVSQ